MQPIDRPDHDDTEVHLDLIDFALEADGDLRPPVGPGPGDDLLQQDGLFLPHVQDGPKPPLDLLGLGLEQLAQREQVPVPAVERQLGASCQERQGVSAVGTLDPQGDIGRSGAEFHG